MNYWSIKDGGFKVPSDVKLEDYEFVITHQPAEVIDDPYYFDIIRRIYGDAFAMQTLQTRRVPENIEEKWLLAGVHYHIGEAPVTVDIPEVGIPAYARLVLNDLKLIKQKLGI